MRSLVNPRAGGLADSPAPPRVEPLIPRDLANQAGNAAFLTAPMGVAAAGSMYRGDDAADAAGHAGSVAMAQLMGRMGRGGVNRVTQRTTTSQHTRDTDARAELQAALRRDLPGAEDAATAARQQIADVDATLTQRHADLRGLVPPPAPPGGRFDPSVLPRDQQAAYATATAEQRAARTLLRKLESDAPWRRGDPDIPDHRRRVANVQNQIAEASARAAAIRGAYRTSAQADARSQGESIAQRRQQVEAELRDLERRRLEIARQGQAADARVDGVNSSVKGIDTIDAQIAKRRDLIRDIDQGGRAVSRGLGLAAGLDSAFRGDDSLTRRSPLASGVGDAVQGTTQLGVDAASLADLTDPVDWGRVSRVVGGLGAVGVLGYLAYKLSQPSEEDEEEPPPKPATRRGRPPGTGRGRGRPRKVAA